MTTSYPCPRCGAAASLPDGCPACGAGPDPDAAEVIRLDAEIAELTRQLHDARAQVTALDRKLHDTRAVRNQTAARVVAGRGPAPAPVPVAVLAPIASAPPVEPRLSTLTVQNVLFIIGGLLLVVAAAVFTAVAWAQVGVTGRALLLTGATVAVLAVPPFAVRRGLTAAAETLAAVGLLMILLDGYAAWAVDFLWVRLLDPWGYAAAVLAFTSAVAVGYSSLTKLRGPRIAALLMGQPVLPLLAAAGDVGLVWWSAAFTGTAALDLAALRLRAARFTVGGFGGLASVCAVVTGGVGACVALRDLASTDRPGAAAVAGVALLLPFILLLVWALMIRKPFAQAVAAGLVVVVAGVAGTRWAWTLPIDFHDSGWQAGRLAAVALVLAAVTALLPRTRPLIAPASTLAPAPPAPPSAAGSPSTDAARLTSAAPSSTTSPSADPGPLTSAAPSEVSTGARSVSGSSGLPVSPLSSGPSRHFGDSPGVSGLRRWVRGEVGFGAWIGALLVAAAPAATVLLAAAAGGVRSVQAARPVFEAPLDRGVDGPGTDLLVAASVTAVAYALMLPRRTLANLGLTALAVVGLIVPAAFGLAWWTATVAGLVVAVVALGLAARAHTPTDVGYRVVFCLAGATHAILTGVGSANVIAAVSGLITVLGVGVALALRDSSRKTDVGAGAMVAGLLAAPATVWLVLFAAEVPVTWRVRVTLGVAALLCLVAHAVHRRIPVYGRQALGVALVVVGFAPAWAAPGSDPAVLYSAAALLLIVTLLPLPDARTAAGAVAAVLPGLALLAVTATDLAVVLLEPWTALRDVWSGLPPQQSPVAWSNVAALAAAGLAASTGGRLLARTGSLVMAFAPVGATTSDSATTHSGPGEPLPDGPEPVRAAASASGTASDVDENPVPAGVPASARVVAACAALPFVAVLVPLIFAAGGLAWPAVPIAGLVTGLGGLLAVALAPGRHTVGNLLAVLFGALAAAGVAGSAAGHGATVAAFTLVLVTGLVAGVHGRAEFDRVAGWLAGSVSVVVVAYTIADLADLGLAGPPLLVLTAAAAVIGLEWLLAGRRPAEAWAPLVVGHGSALVAVLLTGDDLGWAALVCKLWALVLTVRALRPGETRRFGYGMAAGSVALVGWWLLLTSRDVETTEIYTLPAAALALAAGWFARRNRPELPSWSAYGAALAAAFLPTLAVIANTTADEPQYLRRLLLGVGALVVLVVGARARLQAPVVTGGATLLLVALHELIQFWDLVPRWAPLAIGGLLLVGIATTMEQRRRDLARLRTAIAGMA
ncbi:SCO7613 C-terminal domain-containing membrane protein [Actinoplanes sichuanensis]|uniref:SCO7613 C-terminal domain-containing membrane protein n=1 Tax=Actinoplanes sichuanensis TaxID=512349 RepID=A0ABW4ACK0_9ACTN|nr:hypothetical protein [Actinoplanes sichuanensis]